MPLFLIMKVDEGGEVRWRTYTGTVKDIYQPEWGWCDTVREAVASERFSDVEKIREALDGAATTLSILTILGRL